MIFSLLYDMIRYTIITYSLLQPTVWLDIVVFIMCVTLCIWHYRLHILCVYIEL